MLEKTIQNKKFLHVILSDPLCSLVIRAMRGAVCIVEVLSFMWN